MFVRHTVFLATTMRVLLAVVMFIVGVMAGETEDDAPITHQEWVGLVKCRRTHIVTLLLYYLASFFTDASYFRIPKLLLVTWLWLLGANGYLPYTISAIGPSDRRRLNGRRIQAGINRLITCVKMLVVGVYLVAVAGWFLQLEEWNEITDMEIVRIVNADNTDEKGDIYYSEENETYWFYVEGEDKDGMTTKVVVDEQMVELHDNVAFLDEPYIYVKHKRSYIVDPSVKRERKEEISIGYDDEPYTVYELSAHQVEWLNRIFSKEKTVYEFNVPKGYKFKTTDSKAMSL